MVDAETKRRIGVLGTAGERDGADQSRRTKKLNMDAQDAQDKQDGTLLHAELTSAMIRFGFADAQE